MTIWWLVLILAAIGAVGIAFIWLAVRVSRVGAGPAKSGNQIGSFEEAAENDVEHLLA